MNQTFINLQNLASRFCTVDIKFAVFWKWANAVIVGFLIHEVVQTPLPTDTWSFQETGQLLVFSQVLCGGSLFFEIWVDCKDQAVLLQELWMMNEASAGLVALIL